KYAGPAHFAGGWHWLSMVGWLMVGLLTALLARFAFCVWIFWTDRSWALNRLYFQFFTFATKPDAIYPKAIRYLVLTALPFAFIGSVPARALLFGLQPWEYVTVASVLTAFLVMNSILWRRGLGRYQSASS
ncbi:MAG: ABC-2 family transporter protein, partial [Bdellovibrionota bacterium]